MHDVHTLERYARIPSVAIVTTAFAKQALFQSEALGFSDPEKHIVLAEHPISDASSAEIAAKADLLYADLIRQVVKPTSHLLPPTSYMCIQCTHAQVGGRACDCTAHAPSSLAALS